MSNVSSDWPYPGARWWKFDFHTHTPASKDTPAWQRAMGRPDEVTPEIWLLKFMAAEIDCVAITDHNSGVWIDSLKSAYASMKANPPNGFRELHLFPGVELSVSSGLHVLALFDTTATSNTITSLLGGIGFPGHLYGETNGENEAACSRNSLVEVIDEIHRCGGIAIPAHVDAERGLLQTKKDTTTAAVHADAIKSVLDSNLLAVEVKNRSHPKPTVYTQSKVRWTEVLGSDCHSFHSPTIPGSRFTWIKMAAPTLDGLRLALLDGQDISVRRSDEEVGFTPFDRPEHFVEALEIHDARVMGRDPEPAVFQFNPYFNALVGGRGTGKSTLIHALRLAYRRENELDSQSESAQTFERFNRVAKNHADKGGLLPNSHVALIVHRDGVRHRVHWRQDGQGMVVEDAATTPGTWLPSASQAVTPQRFPVRLFSQGQIAALSGDSQQALLTVIDEAAGTAHAESLLGEAKRLFLATRAKMRELQGRLQSRDALNVSLQDVRRKLQRFEATHHAEVLKTYQRSSRQAREVKRQFESVDELVSRLRATAGDLLAEDLPAGLFNSIEDAEALTVMQQLSASITQSKNQLEAAADTLAATSLVLKNQLEQGAWQTQLEQGKVAYDVLKADLQTQGVSDPSEYGRLVQERQRLETDTQRLDSLQTQFDELKAQAQMQWTGVGQARQAITQARTVFLQNTLANNPFVRISLIPYGRDAQALERSLRDVLGVNDEKFKEDIYVEAQEVRPAKGLIADVLLFADSGAAPNSATTLAFEASIKQLQTRLTQACLGAEKFGARFNKYLISETAKRPEFSDHILCWFPDDSLAVSYSRNGDGKDFEPIGQASAGQRAAAMLAFLLAHGTEPLVLDQPEDDLDNHLIYNLVVQQIRANKQRRQLIIVTHNPNIVVNGDAEMIHVMDFDHQCFVSQRGSLQDHKMRDEVCTVMEGGKEAFERRYQRLGRKV